MDGLAAFLKARLDEDERRSEAKRAILAEFQARNDGDPRSADADYVAGLALTVSALASVYSDHPDYRAEWKP